MASRESLSLDSGNQSPNTETATTTRMSCSGITTDSRSADADSLLAEEEETAKRSLGAVGGASESGAGGGGGGGSTHIIRVTGPVTNLDETVLSGAVPQHKASSSKSTAARSSEVANRDDEMTRI